MRTLWMDGDYDEHESHDEYEDENELYDEYANESVASPEIKIFLTKLMTPVCRCITDMFSMSATTQDKLCLTDYFISIL